MRWRLLFISPMLAATACVEPSDQPGKAAAGDDTDESDVDSPVDTDPDSDSMIDTDTDLPSPPMVVVASGPRICLNPALRDTRRGSKMEAREQVLGDGELNLRGGTVVVADFTGDLLYDIFLPGIHEGQMHIHQPNHDFVDEWDTRLAGLDLNESTGASVVDVDADGDLDLFVTRWQQPSKLLINNGLGYFTDGTAAAGLGGASLRGQSSVWGDIDRDLDLDLVIGNYGPRPADSYADPELFEIGDPDQIWRNNGDGTFTDVSYIFPQVVHDAFNFNMAFHDLDLDGWDELLVINDFGWILPSRIFWNTSAGLVMDDGSAGFDIPFAGMGLGVGDFNDDEIPDFVQSSWKESSVLLSQGGTWFEFNEAFGIVPDVEGPGQQIFGWGTEVTDLDNDGDLDIVMNYGYWDDYGPNYEQVDAVYIQVGVQAFDDQARDWGLADKEASRGLVTIDMNEDGWIDVVKRLLDGKTPLYMSNCGAEGWLRIRTRGPAPNTFAIGTRIRVIDEGKVWTRQVHAGGTGMYSGYHPEAHFGLGMQDEVDRIEFIWPGGEMTFLEHVATRQVLDVTWTP